jgi:hypothetical protein
MNTSTYTFKDIFREQEKNLNTFQNSYIHSAKLDAFEEFEKLGFPTRKNEAWKYTNVSSFTRASLNPLFFPQQHLDIKKSDFRYYNHIRAHKLVVVNGSFQAHLSEIIEDENKNSIMTLFIATISVMVLISTIIKLKRTNSFLSKHAKSGTTDLGKVQRTRKIS